MRTFSPLIASQCIFWGVAVLTHPQHPQVLLPELGWNLLCFGWLLMIMATLESAGISPYPPFKRKKAHD
jgi:hypothetical protein